MMITQEYLKKLFDYENGRLVRKIRRNNKIAGSEAGTLTKYGYRRIGIDGKYYVEHRLIWMYHYGKFPTQFIDHINRNRSDNRIENLRDVNRRQNNQNRENFNFGARWHTQRNKWQSIVSFNGKQKSLGLFDTKEAAQQAYINAVAELG